MAVSPFAHPDSWRVPKSSTKPALVLVIDEDANVRRTLSDILRGDGHRVARASSVLEARSVLNERNLAVVVLGLGARPFAGLEMLDRIKRRRPEVVLVATALRGGVEEARRSRSFGAFEFVPKPCDRISELQQIVWRALAHQGVLGQLFALLREWAPGADTARPPASKGSAECPNSEGRHELASLLDLACAVRSARRRETSSQAPSNAARPHEGMTEPWPPLSLAAYERLALERALMESGGDATRAARALGIGRSTFYRKAAKHGLALPRTENGRPRASSPSAAGRGVGAPESIR